jgi:hypothetical protein
LDLHIGFDKVGTPLRGRELLRIQL